jgi:hypothetical protein
MDDVCDDPQTIIQSHGEDELNTRNGGCRRAGHIKRAASSALAVGRRERLAKFCIYVSGGCG